MIQGHDQGLKSSRQCNFHCQTINCAAKYMIFNKKIRADPRTSL